MWGNEEPEEDESDLSPLDKFAHRIAEDLRFEHITREQNRIFKKKPISLHVWVDPELHAEIVALAKKLNISQANLLRFLIRSGLASEEITGTDFTAPTKMLFGRTPEKPTSLDPSAQPLHRAPKRPPKFGEV